MTDDEGDYSGLTISAFLRGRFVRGLDEDGGEGGLFELIEERIRAAYPGASVSVQAAELLDSDTQIHVGRLQERDGQARFTADALREIEHALRHLIPDAAARFGQTPPRPG